jgi:cytochrome c551/c552
MAVVSPLVLFLLAFAGPPVQTFQEAVAPFVQNNCVACHNDKMQSGGLNLKTPADVVKGRDQWARVAEKLKRGEMPPKGFPRPAVEQIAAVTKWLDDEFARQDAALRPDPGRVTARRLNRYEYNATVRDLLAVDFKPADDFPTDDFGYGFDNIGDVLTLSPTLMEKYLTAARNVARMAIEGEAPPKMALKDRYKNESRKQGEFTWERKFKWEADYVIRLEAATKYPGVLYFSWDGGDPQSVRAIPGFVATGRIHDYKMHVPYGMHKMTAWFEVNETEAIEQHDKEEADKAKARKKKGQPEPAEPPKPFKVPKGAVDYFEVLGPYSPKPQPTPDGYKKVFVCAQHNDSCVRADLENLASLAWRRPAAPAEVTKLAGYVKMAEADGEPFDKAMEVGVEAVLVSPYFLYRMERDPAPGTEHRISDYELASRLSYFLWSSMPDAELFRLARENRLHEPAVLAAQVSRMMKDLKSDALVDNFGGQWLQTRNLDRIKPDPDKFGAFTPDLRKAMKMETQLFFSYIMRYDRSILDFLSAKYTFVNEPLAKLYGLPNVKGDNFRMVDLTGTPRVGILTQGSVLTVSSYPTRTSPVIRGKWILENVLNTPPPPPPPNVPSLKEAEAGSAMSVRQSLEKHRQDPVCASCHSRMDPLGFGLENFDAIGRYRTVDGKFPIDASGTLPSGKSFENAEGLIKILQDDKEAFTRCLVEKMMTFALGRGLERYDRPVVSAIANKVAGDQYKFSTLVMAIVTSAPFEMRHAEAARPAAQSGGAQ